DADEEPRLLDGDRGLGGERGEERLVVLVEEAALLEVAGPGPGVAHRAAALVEHLDDADDAPELAAQRDAQHGAGAEAALLVPGAREARVGVGVAHVGGAAGARDLAGDPLADVERDL